MRILLFSVLAFGLMAACSQSESKNEMTLQQEVDALVAEAKFDEAMTLLEEEPKSPEVTSMKESVHLQHGIHLIYNSDPSEMRESANKALREFIAVLEINPENEKAKAEINQILGIYRTFPDRQPAEDILEKLEEMGFQV